MGEGRLQILQMENGEDHTTGAVTALALNFLPHDTADTDVGHQDDVRQIFQMNCLLTHDIYVLHIQTFSIECRVIYPADLLENLGDTGNGDIGAFQILQHIICAEQRTESSDPSEGDLVDLREHIPELVIDLGHGIVLQCLELCIRNIATDLLFVNIIGIILVKFVPAGRFLPAEDGHQPVIKGIDADIAVIRHGFCHAVQGDCIFQTGQLLIHITEIQKHFDRHGNVRLFQRLGEQEGVEQIKFFGQLSA